MLRGLLSFGSRLTIAVLALLLGLLPSAPAIGPNETPAEVIVQPADPVPALQFVYLAAYRGHGPPVVLVAIISQEGQNGTFRRRYFALVGTSSRSAGLNQYAYAGGDPINRWDPSGLAWVWNTEAFDWEWDPNPRIEIEDPERGPGFVMVTRRNDGPNPGNQFKPSIIPGNGDRYAILMASNHGSYNPEYLGELTGALAPFGQGLIDAAGGQNAYYGHLDGLYAQLYMGRIREGEVSGFAIQDAAAANSILNEYARLMLAPAPPLISGAAVMDGVQGGLDAAGFFPGLGAIPDLLNSGIYLLRGDGAEALMSLAAAVPAAGDTYKGLRVTDDMVAGARALQRRAHWITDNQGLVRALEGAGPLSGRAMDVIEAARAEATLGGKVRLLRQGDVFNAQQRRYLIENFVVCFPSGTQVVTRDGTKAIEALNVGDEVLSWDEKSGEQGFRPIVRTFESQSSELVYLRVELEGETRLIRCTAEHPFWTDANGWVRAASLATGMQVDLADGGNAAVISVSIQPEVVTVYNVEVEGWHTYYVLPDGVDDAAKAVLAHNRCGGGTARLRGALGSPPTIPGGAPSNFSWQAHHIFPQHLHSTPLGRQLQAWGVDLEGAANGLYLPSRGFPGNQMAIHRGGHTAAYYTEVISALSGATNATEAQAILNYLRGRLSTGDLLLNGARP